MRGFLCCAYIDGATGPAGPTGAAPALNAVNAVNAAAQTPAATGDALTFADNQVTAGTAVTHTAGSGDFTITEPGTYEVTYSTTGTTTATAPPVTASVQLNLNGAEIPGSGATNTITAAGDTAALAGNTLISVTTAPATVTLTANNTNVAFSNSSITVHKVG